MEKVEPSTTLCNRCKPLKFARRVAKRIFYTMLLTFNLFLDHATQVARKLHCVKPGFHQIVMGSVKSCDSSWSQLIVERLLTIENKNLEHNNFRFSAQGVFVINS